VALPHLRPFAAEKLVVAMAVLWQRQVCYLIHASPGRRPEEGIAGHGLYATHESIMGVSLLAAKSDGEICDLYCGGPRPGLSGNAFAALMAEVRAAREQGYSYRHDRDTGKVAFAFNIGEPAVAAVSLTGQIEKPRLPGLIERLGAAARAITAELHHA
jgi:DNA-binding IclR family transcriptional regulator